VNWIDPNGCEKIEPSTLDECRVTPKKIADWTDAKGGKFIQIPTPTADLILIRGSEAKRNLWKGKNVVEIKDVQDAIEAIRKYGETHDDFTVLISDHGRPGDQAFGGGNPKLAEYPPGTYLSMEQGQTRLVLNGFTETLREAGVWGILFADCNVGLETGTANDDFLWWIAEESGVIVSAYNTSIITDSRGFLLETPDRNRKQPQQIIIMPRW
jgi:hypothetical protein